MPSIVFKEFDNTTPGVSASQTDIAYIPGFVEPYVFAYTLVPLGEEAPPWVKNTYYSSKIVSGITSYSLTYSEPDNWDTNYTDYYTRDKYINPSLIDELGRFKLIDANLPQLCRTLDEFKTLFGDKVPTFIQDESYPTPSGSDYGFATTEFKSGEFMFLFNTPEPGYVMASKLLSLGLPIIYERVNDFVEVSLGNTEPDDWSKSAEINGVTCVGRQKYFTKDENGVYIQVAYDASYNKDNDYYIINDVEVSTMYSALVTKIYTNGSSLLDKGDLGPKYLTSGGYPVFGYGPNTDSSALLTAMVDVAATRGDCVALIDHTNYRERTLNPTDSASVYSILQSINHLSAVVPNTNIQYGSYGAMFTPWANYSLGSDIGVIQLPASFAYLACLATSVSINPNWLATAGCTRGIVPFLTNGYPLNTKDRLTNAIAESYETRDGSISINPITKIDPYGYVIWGNRTLIKNIDNLVATSFLNIRNIISEVKKIAYKAAKKLIFEQNSDVLWVNFKSEITPLLDQMTSGYGLESYKIIKGQTTEKAKLIASIKLVPIYAVEDFEISVSMEDSEVTVEG